MSSGGGAVEVFGRPDRPVALRAPTDGDADAIAGWRYAGRDAVYDTAEEPPDPADGYAALVDPRDGTLVGFVCTGAEARVPGQVPTAGVVDIGVGLRPDLVGGGWGASVVAAALAVARRTGPEVRTVRAAVLAWNTRSRRTLAGAGFTEQGRLATDDGRSFVILVRPLRS